jgi:UDP-glucose 4-epimerase
LQRRDFVYVDDVVDAVELALDRQDEVTWNVSSGRASSVLDLLDALQAITGLKSPICWQPARAGDVRSSQLAPDRLLSTGQWGPPVDLATGLTRLIAAESRASQSLQESALGAVKSA